MTPERHDHDAGGDPDVLEAKAALREQVWDRLEDGGVGRFPGIRNRIPNFIGAEDAGERLRGTDAWQRAATLKSNPDSPQWPVRQRALEDGKVVAMAAPRLKSEQPFLLLDPDRLEESPRDASSIKGANRNAVPAGVEDLEPIDLVVVGCVAVTSDGARLGKGGGFADLELAIVSDAGLLHADTVVVTTVHPLQVLEPGEIPTTDHDLRVDLIITPEDVIDARSDRAAPRTPGIRWDELTDEKIDSIPILQRLRERSAG